MSDLELSGHGKWSEASPHIVTATPSPTGQDAPRRRPRPRLKTDRKTHVDLGPRPRERVERQHQRGLNRQAQAGATCGGSTPAVGKRAAPMSNSARSIQRYGTKLRITTFMRGSSTAAVCARSECSAACTLASSCGLRRTSWRRPHTGSGRWPSAAASGPGRNAGGETQKGYSQVDRASAPASMKSTLSARSARSPAK